MSRFEPLIGAVALCAFGALLFILSNSSGALVFEAPEPGAVPTLSIIPALVLPSLPLPTLGPETATTTAPTPAVLFAPAAPAPRVPSATPPASVESTPLEKAAVALREALVNILCIVPPGGGIRSISASGIIVDPKGIILTNAHVAQYFLLADRGVSCTIRTGSPATSAYLASPIYLSPAWIEANAGILAEANPIGTGEHDYAFLVVTKSASGAALPSFFPYLRLASVPPEINESVAVASYGAQALDYDQIRSALYPTVVFSRVKDVFTFGTDSVDVVALSGSSAAQEGSSGGGVVNSTGALIATITTSTVEGDTSSRSLDAITASYVRADYEREAGEPLPALLAGEPAVAAALFASKAPAFEALVTKRLP